MNTLTQARQALADALDGLPGISMHLRELRNGKALDGWTIAGPVRPDGFSDSMAEVRAVILLSADYVKADELFDDLATAAVDTVTAANLGTTDVRVEPGIVTVGDAASPMYALIVNASMEVQ